MPRVRPDPRLVTCPGPHGRRERRPSVPLGGTRCLASVRIHGSSRAQALPDGGNVVYMAGYGGRGNNPLGVNEAAFKVVRFDVR